MQLRMNAKPYDSAQAPLDAEGTFQPVSFWQESVPMTAEEPLVGRAQCDVAVVGGGFTGLSTARALKAQHPELDVVLLERGVAGHGASGRNGGFAMPLFGWDLRTTVKQLGRERGKAVYDLMYAAVDELRDTIETKAIACDAEYTGYVLMATCAAREKYLQQELETAHELGYEHHWLSSDGLEEHIRSDAFRSGIYDPRPFIVNPAKLAQGLKALAMAEGVRVYEQTPLEQLEDGETVCMKTLQGELRAKRVVLGLNGYGPALGFQKHTLLPVHSYIVLTAPLSDDQLEAIGWHRHRASLETARNLIHYFRLTADNRIAFGGADADMYYGGAHRDHDPRIYGKLEEALWSFFPSLRKHPITHRWGGTLGVTLDMYPTFGVAGNHQNIFYGSGYSGHGVALANYAGALLAPAVLGSLDLKVEAQGEVPFFFNRRQWPLPPDPIRYLGMKAYGTLLRAQDTWQGA